MNVFRRVSLLLFLSSLPLVSSCTYFERFIIRLEERPGLPCLGLNHIEFTVEALSENQDAIVQKKAAEGFQNAQLFWNTTTGKCQLSNGILLKQIPYGGERKLTILGYDSSGTYAVASGSSSPFLVEASGNEVQTEITMQISRKADIKPGTVIIRFDNTLPAASAQIEALFQAHQGLPEDRRSIKLQTSEALPKFLILSNLPLGQERPGQLLVLDKDGKTIAQTQTFKFSIADTSPDLLSTRIAVSFAAANP